ncbi:MAG TPA: hypothetical protein VN715_13480 [Roseiarcus sp.]|nr:hypothetical protein [Roseiarcus sp.]
MSGLYDNTLRLAESLSTGEIFGGAASRRAVSSAYYSVFQRLSSLCASRLSGQDPGSEEYLRLYRALEHKLVRAALNRGIYKVELGVRFERLQDARHWADYSIAPHPDSSAGRGFTPSEAQFYVDMARGALQFVDSLDKAAQLKLAILLIIRDRRTSRPHDFESPLSPHARPPA